MIVERKWERYKRGVVYYYTGWFLFGIIPLFIRRGIHQAGSR